MIDDEPRRVLRHHRCVPHLSGIKPHLFNDIGRRFQSWDDLDHPHEWHRVEKMESNDLSLTTRPGSDGCDRQGRSICGQDRGAGRQRHQVCHELAFDVDVLNDSFDNQVATGQFGQCSGCYQVVAVLLCILWADFSLF